MKKTIFLLILFIFLPFKLQASEQYSISITSPQGGGDYKVGQTMRISWNQLNMDTVHIGLMLSPGEMSYITPATGITVNKSSTSFFYDWVIPDEVLGAGDIKKSGLKVRLLGYDSGFGSATSYSEEFSISTNKPYLAVSLDPASPQGKIAYSQDLVTAKFKLQAKDGDLQINNLYLYLKNQDNDVWYNVSNLKILNGQGQQINKSTELRSTEVLLKENLNLHNGDIENISVSFNPYYSFSDYSGGDFNFCLRYQPLSTSSAPSVNGALCANRVSTDKIPPKSTPPKSTLPDLKVLSASAQPASAAEKFDLAVYFAGLPTASFSVPYKIKLTNKKDGQTYFAAVNNNVQKNVDFILPFGVYQGEIMIDSDNVIKESDETNNTLVQDFSYCGANQIANCGNTSNAVLKISSEDDYYSGRSRTYYSNSKYINLINLDLTATEENIKLNSLTFSPFNQNDYLANLVNIRLMNGAKEIASTKETFSSDYWNDPKIPKVPGYFNFKNINFIIPAKQSVNFSVIAELGTKVTKDVNYFSYNLTSVQAIKNDNSIINYSAGSQDKEGLGNLPIKGLTTIIKAAATSTPLSYSDFILKNKLLSNYQAKDQVAGANSEFSKKQGGKILLQVESKGEAWYINPKDGKGYYMADGNSAYEVMKKLGIGVNNKDMEKIKTDANFRKKFIGKILLQVESHGEAYYISSNGRYNYLKDGAAAYNVMRNLGVGISNKDLDKITKYSTNTEANLSVPKNENNSNIVLTKNTDIIVKDPKDLTGNNYILHLEAHLPYKTNYCQIIKKCTGYKDLVLVGDNQNACRCEFTKFGCSGDSCLNVVEDRRVSWRRISSITCTGCQ